MNSFGFLSGLLKPGNLEAGKGFWKSRRCVKANTIQSFKEKLQKKVIKMKRMITPIQPDLPGLQFMQETFHENGYCSQSCGL